MSSKKRVSNGLPSSARLKRRKSSDLSADELELDTKIMAPTVSQTTTARKTHPSQHVRFGSGSPSQQQELNGRGNPSTAPTNSVRPVNKGDGVEDVDELDLGENSSDDDAPEDVSAATAKQHARASRAKASTAAAKQRTQQKQQRRQRDARLKSQAEASAAAATPKYAADDAGEQGGSLIGERENAKEERQRASPPSPELLPTHVLEDEVLRQFPLTPSPPPQAKPRPPSAHGKKIVLRDPSPQPRDRRAGPLSVRVLQNSSAWLPPKANGKARALRESWLRGRTGSGKMTEGTVKRMAVNQGFAKQ